MTISIVIINVLPNQSQCVGCKKSSSTNFNISPVIRQWFTWSESSKAIDNVEFDEAKGMSTTIHVLQKTWFSNNLCVAKQWMCHINDYL